MNNLFLISLWALGSTFPGCSHVDGGQRTKSFQPIIQVNPFSKIPPSFPVEMENVGVTLTLSKDMVGSVVVTRPTAEVRDFPSIDSNLKNYVFENGSALIATARTGPWLRVNQPATGRGGWVHIDAVSMDSTEHKPVKISVRDLSIVIATKPVEEVFSFPEEEPVRVNVPKGSLFHLIRHKGQRKLLWIASTNSLIWVNERDFQ